MSLVWRLYLLVALAMLPAVAIQAWNEVALRRERTAASHAEAQRLAEFASAEMERMVDGGRILLTTLASASSIRLRQAEGCSTLIEQATAGLPQFSVIGAIDQQGHWICRIGAGAGLDLDGAESRWRRLASSAFETRVVGFVAGGENGRPLLVMVRAFTDFSGDPGGALVVGIDLGWLQSYFATRSLPFSGAIAVADRDGHLLFRQPGHIEPGALVRNTALLTATLPGTIEVAGPDDVTRIVGYVPPAARLGGEFLVLVGIAKAPAMAAIDSATQRGIVLIGLGAVLALLAAWLGAKLFIGRPAQALLSAADAWGRGDLAARTGLQAGPDEFGRLAGAFDSMAAVLEAGEVELKASHAALRARDDMLALVEQSAETGSWDFDLASKTVRGTPNFFRLHGVEPSGGAVPHELVRASQHPDDRPRVAAEFAAVVASSADGFEVEYRVKGREGWHWLLGRGHVVRDRRGVAVGYAGIDMDITGRKRSEAALRAGEARLRLALEAGRMGVFDVDLGNERRRLGRHGAAALRRRAGGCADDPRPGPGADPCRGSRGLPAGDRGGRRPAFRLPHRVSRGRARGRHALAGPARHGAARCPGRAQAHRGGLGHHRAQAAGGAAAPADRRAEPPGEESARRHPVDRAAERPAGVHGRGPGAVAARPPSRHGGGA